MTLSRPLKIGLWSVAALFATLALCVVVLVLFDWNRAKPWLSERVTQATDRTFVMQGDLALAWQRADAPASGWRGWVPWPHISAQEVVLGNPVWVKDAPHMAKVGRASFSLSPFGLLDKKILVKNLVLEDAQLFLERAKDKKNNWTFAPKDSSQWQFAINRIAFENGQIHLVDAITRADLIVKIDTAADKAASAVAVYKKPSKITSDTSSDTSGDTPADKAMATTTVKKPPVGNDLIWSVAGSLDKQAVKGSGKAGDILALQQHSRPYPIEADVRVGKTALAIKGTLTDPRSLAALDVRLKVSGVSMAKLYSLTGIPFPETPAFATDGRLVGKIDKNRSEWKYEKFSGKVGSSDLSGTFEYEARQPRPYLRGTLVSNKLVFADLAPLIGADSKASKAKRDAPSTQPGGKVFPVERFQTERWTSIDADVKFTGRRILRDKQLPIENLVTELQLQNGVLSLKPLNFGFAGGDLLSTIEMDGRGKQIKAKIKLAARKLQLKQLFPGVALMRDSKGQMNGDAMLSATGNSVAAILASSNGEIKASISGGTLSKLMLEQIGLNIGSVVLTQLTGDKQVKLNCMASDFAVANGQMQTRSFLIDTEDAAFNISGRIDLAQEKLDLTVEPDTKTLRVISLQAPLYITGSFKAPKVNVDRGVLAAKAGAAIALGVLAPVLTAVIPLVAIGPGKESDCAKLLGTAREKPVAPLPGKPYRGKPVPQAATS